MISSRINRNKIILTGHRQDNIYMFDLNDLSSCKVECLVAMNSDESWLELNECLEIKWMNPDLL